MPLERTKRRLHRQAGLYSSSSESRPIQTRACKDWVSFEFGHHRRSRIRIIIASPAALSMGADPQSLDASQPTSEARGPAAQRLRPKGAPPSPWSVTSRGRSGTGQQITIGSRISTAEVRLPVSPHQQEHQVIQAHGNHQMEGAGRNEATKR